MLLYIQTFIDKVLSFATSTDCFNPWLAAFLGAVGSGILGIVGIIGTCAYFRKKGKNEKQGKVMISLIFEVALICMLGLVHDPTQMACGLLRMYLFYCWKESLTDIPSLKSSRFKSARC